MDMFKAGSSPFQVFSSFVLLVIQFNALQFQDQGYCFARSFRGALVVVPCCCSFCSGDAKCITQAEWTFWNFSFLPTPPATQTASFTVFSSPFFKNLPNDVWDIADAFASGRAQAEWLFFRVEKRNIEGTTMEKAKKREKMKSEQWKISLLFLRFL